MRVDWNEAKKKGLARGDADCPICINPLHLDLILESIRNKKNRKFKKKSNIKDVVLLSCTHLFHDRYVILSYSNDLVIIVYKDAFKVLKNLGKSNMKTLNAPFVDLFMIKKYCNKDFFVYLHLWVTNNINGVFLTFNGV